MAASAAPGTQEGDMLRSVQTEEKQRGAAVVYAPSFFRSEEALLAGLRRGERGARAVFYQRHRQEVEQLVRRVLGFDAEVTDVVSAVFLRSVAKLHTFKGSAGSLRGWLLRLAVRELRWRLLVRRVRGWVGVGVASRWQVSQALGLRSQRALAREARLAEAQLADAQLVDTQLVDAQVRTTGHAQMQTAVGAHSPEPADVLSGGRNEESGVSHLMLQMSHEPPHRQFYALAEQLAPRERIAFCLHFVGGVDVGEVADLMDCSLSVARNRVADAKSRFVKAAKGVPSMRSWLAVS